ncbi:insulinase family protein [Myxococcota bacterium]|nr:insulinase family protein [Myxococcota bacterium]
MRPSPTLAARALAALLPALALGASGCAPKHVAPPPPPAATTEAPPPPPDPLGPPPLLPKPTAYAPPVPKVIAIEGLPEVWLVERHGLPLVGVVIVVPAGSSADPKGKGGLAALTAEMMQQGAGSRGALDLSRATESLGAKVQVSAGFDGSTASLAVIKGNLLPALDILADVVARPRFEGTEWKRIQPLWLGDLRSRAFEPRDVAHVASLAALFGPDHPYGHAVQGSVDSVQRLKLEDVKGFHRKAWRPDRAVMVVVGDVTEDEVRAALPPIFARWKAPEGDPGAPVTPPPPTGPWPRLVVVDRPGSPQTMLRVVWPGPAASDPVQDALALVNVPLGGSFTSRLNQNLREDKGYTYGARSSVPFTRGPGAFAAAASVQTEVTGAALTEMLKELAGISASGPTAEEIAKARSSLRNEDVETYEGVFTAANRLAGLALLGLPPDRDATSAAARDALTYAAVAEVAARISASGIVVAVGDRAAIEPQLVAAGLPAPEIRDPEGKVIAAAPAPAPAAPR